MEVWNISGRASDGNQVKLNKAPRERQEVIAIICSASGESRVSEDPPKTPCTLNKMSLLKTFALIIFSVRDKDVFCGCKFKISIGDESLLFRFTGYLHDIILHNII